MCGRYTLEINPGILWGRFGLPGDMLEDLLPELKPRYNIAPGQQVLAVVDGDGMPRPEFMRWGLVPLWAKDEKIGYRMINARAETVATTNAFRVPFQRRRCLILADGFYEWRKDGKAKTPMRIVLRYLEPFAFAGLWEQWTAPTGAIVHSCTIITTTPNSLIEPIHNRMPVMLTPEAESVWLDRRIEDPETLTRLLAPYPSEEMESYEVSTIVNSPKNDTPDCVAPLP